jgi:hypothetical protein
MGNLLALGKMGPGRKARIFYYLGGMTDEALKTNSIDQLLAHMISLTNDVLDMHKEHINKQEIRTKLLLLQKIQRIIVEKRSARQTSL